jgi:membrane protein
MSTHSRKSPPPVDAEPHSTRSLGNLLRELAAQSSDLLKQELALARAEVRESVGEITGAVRQLTIGGAIAAVGVLVLTAFAVVLLGGLLGNYWLGALIVAAVLLAAGGGLIFLGLSRLRDAEVAPTDTLESIRSTGTWAGVEASELRHALSADASSTDRTLRSRGHTGTATIRGPGGRAALPPAGESSAPSDGAFSPGEGRSTDDASRSTRVAAAGSLPKRVAKEFMEDNVAGESAKVAYYAFLALPPAILVTFALLGFFGGSATAEWMTERLQAALPEGAESLVDGFVTQIVHESAPGPFSIGLLLALWAASNVFMALGEALNNTYDVTEDRSWFRRRALAVGVMLAAVLLMLVASVSLIAGPQIAGALNLWGAANLAWTLLQWPLAFLFVAAAFFLVYYVLPNRDQGACKPLLFKAALAAAALWLIASFGFRLYVSNFASYSETYGILGAVIVLLLWLYVTGLVVLTGGEIASEMEKEA